MPTEIRVLGTVEVTVDGRRVDIGHAKQRAVLAILAAEAGRVVPVERLEHRLWSDGVPKRGRATLHSYLTRLRHALNGTGVTMERRANGYVLAVAPSTVDLHRFRDLTSRAAAGGTEAAELWEQALGLWRGEPFDGVDVTWLQQLADGLRAERLDAEIERIDARLRGGHHAGLLPELEAKVAVYPRNERLAAQYMEVLHRSGRAADALGHYRLLCERIRRTGLGREPGAALRELHRRILNDDGGFDGVAVAAPAVPVPRQLPPAPRTFTGREEILASLDDCPGDDIPPIGVVTGPGGIGKTWFVVHWAHHRVERFPDGQLHADLRGFDPAGEPREPQDVLAEFLSALGVATSAVPKSPESRSGLFRSLLAGRRMLLVLDNARDAEQVAPLLPGTATVTTVVTSRRDLAALTTRYGAKRVALESWTPAAARATLAAHLGSARVEAEPEAVGELIGHCAGLPLAVGIVAARAAARPDFPLSALVADLRDATARLDVLDTGELSVGVRAVLDGSYRALTKEAAHVFDLLGLAAGTGWDTYAVASLAGYPPRELRPVLAELERAHLLEQHAPGRYRMHDLTRLYAAEHADRLLTEPERDLVLHRYVDHYLHTAAAHCRTIGPPRRTLELPEPAAGCAVPEGKDAESSRRWFAEETANLLAAQRIASAYGWDTACLLGTVLSGFWRARGFYELAATVARTALDSGTLAGDSFRQAYLRADLALAYGFLGRITEAGALAVDAIATVDVDDLGTNGYVHSAAGFIASQRDDHEQAIAHQLRALECDRAVGRLKDEGQLLNGIGWSHAMLGEYGVAEGYCRDALEHYRRHPSPVGEAAVLDTLGVIAHRRGRPGEAVSLYEEALGRMRTARGNNAGRPIPHESDGLTHLGDAYLALGRVEEARDAWREAAGICRSFHQYGEAARLDEKIAGLQRLTSPAP